RLAPNVLPLCGGGVFQHETSLDAQSLNLALHCHSSTKPPLLQNGCYRAFFFSFICFCCVKSYKYLLSKIISFHCVKWIKVAWKPHTTKVNCQLFTIVIVYFEIGRAHV